MISKDLLEQLKNGVSLEILTQKEKRILELRYGLIDGERLTLEKVGKKFGVTRERIRCIEAKALEKLRQSLNLA